MATVLPITIAPAERIRHPLERLRGTIRRYVTIEGVLSIAIFAALWFWIGLALDYGSFKLAAYDWVQELPRWFRGLILATLSGALTLLVVGKVVRRLLVDFHPASLALVLEQHFPDVLGDRLITAVELADVDRAVRRGSS